MSADRTPQVGEVWTSRYADPYACVGGPDSRGISVWLNGDGAYAQINHVYLYPPKPTPPAWLADQWLNVYLDDSQTDGRSAAFADAYAEECRIGRVSLTGEWVPCRGKEVLS